MALTDGMGRIGLWSSVWSRAIRSGDPAALRATMDAAQELEQLGFGALWLGQSPEVGFAAPVLAATSRIPVATAITPIWQHPAAAVAAAYTDLEQAHPGRFLLGLGVSHAELASGYRQPYAAMTDYLSELDAAGIPAQRRVLAALGPRMLALSRDRAAGAHPYLVTAGQVAQARAVLGPQPLLAPDFKVVLDDDPDRARDTGRRYLTRYLQMRNYVASFERDGFTGADFADGGSDRLLAAVFALGGPAEVAAAVHGLLDAGADHVGLQVVTDDRARCHSRSGAHWRTPCCGKETRLTPRCASP
jgi:probable F420-dependent oxidoreductase